jgi:hypothetical protein
MQGFIAGGKETHEECFPRLTYLFSLLRSYYSYILNFLHKELLIIGVRHYAYISIPVTNTLRYTKFLIIEVTEERL